MGALRSAAVTSSAKAFGWAEALTNRLRQYARVADLGKTGSCHLLRHTTATLMLESGADIRYIQEMLGHVRLGTKEIYTRVSIRQLKAVHDATHPLAKILRGVRKGSTRVQEKAAEKRNLSAVVGPRS